MAAAQRQAIAHIVPRQNEVHKTAGGIKDEINRLSAGDVDSRLRKKWSYPEIVDTCCSWLTSLYLNDRDIDLLDVHTKKALLMHNETVEKIVAPRAPRRYPGYQRTRSAGRVTLFLATTMQ